MKQGRPKIKGERSKERKKPKGMGREETTPEAS